MIYGLNALQTCCECGGGIQQINDDIILTYYPLIIGISSNNDLLCHFNHSNLLNEVSYYFKSWSNLNLHDLCIKLKSEIYKNFIFIKNETLYNNHKNDIVID